MKIAKILVQNTTGLENSNHVFNLSYFAFKKSYITSICAPVNNGILVMCWKNLSIDSNNILDVEFHIGELKLHIYCTVVTVLF